MKAAHFVRKIAQLKASFIRNQIASHIDFSPVLVSRKSHNKLHDGGFAEFQFHAYPHLELGSVESFYEKLIFQGPKILVATQQKRIIRFLREQEASIAHFHYGTDCGVYFPILKKMSIPSVVSFYGYDCSSFPSQYFGYGRRYLQNRVFRDVTAVLAMSPDMKKDLMAAGCPENKIIVHYYGTDCQKFYRQRDYIDHKQPLTFLILASLVPQKGHFFLLKSLLKLKKEGVKGWKMRIVGNGELEDELETFVLNNDLADEVTFVGPVGYGSEEMMREYERADVFVHPSVVAENGDKEGIPGTIIEAMASGLPVISTYHAGIPYIIRHEETGLLVREWEVDQLAGAMKRFLDDFRLRKNLATAGQQYAMAFLDLKEKQRDLEQIYVDLIHRKQVRLVE